MSSGVTPPSLEEESPFAEPAVGQVAVSWYVVLFTLPHGSVRWKLCRHLPDEKRGADGTW